MIDWLIDWWKPSYSIRRYCHLKSGPVILCNRLWIRFASTMRNLVNFIQLLLKNYGYKIKVIHVNQFRVWSSGGLLPASAALWGRASLFCAQLYRKIRNQTECRSACMLLIDPCRPWRQRVLPVLHDSKRGSNRPATSIKAFQSSFFSFLRRGCVALIGSDIPSPAISPLSILDHRPRKSPGESPADCITGKNELQFGGKSWWKIWLANSVKDGWEFTIARASAGTQFALEWHVLSRQERRNFSL